MNEDLQTACRIHIQNMKVVAGGIDGVQEDLRLKNMSQLISEILLWFGWIFIGPRVNLSRLL